VGYPRKDERVVFMIRKFFALIPIVVLAVAVLACEINVGGPAAPDASIPVSTEAVDSLAQTWTDAVASAVDGVVTLTIREDQITSWLTFKLQTQTDPIIQEPQVYLRNGQMQIFGKVHRGILTAAVGITLSVEIDDAGAPRFILQEADFGPWPVPESLLSGLSSALDEAFTGKFGPAATGIRIENIAIAGGQMIIQGRIR